MRDYSFLDDNCYRDGSANSIVRGLRRSIRADQRERFRDKSLMVIGGLAELVGSIDYFSEGLSYVENYTSFTPGQLCVVGLVTFLFGFNPWEYRGRNNRIKEAENNLEKITSGPLYRKDLD